MAMGFRPFEVDYAQPDNSYARGLLQEQRNQQQLADFRNAQEATRLRKPESYGSMQEAAAAKRIMAMAQEAAEQDCVPKASRLLLLLLCEA